MATYDCGAYSELPESDSESPPEPSSTDSDTDLTRTFLFSLKDLKGNVSEWNGEIAHLVYRAFNVKRYKVDEDYILSPVCGSTVDEILELCDHHKSKTSSWVAFDTKIRGVLALFKGDSHFLSTGVTNFEHFCKASKSLLSNIEQQEKRDDPYGLHHRLEILLEEVEQTLQRNEQLPESFFEAYFQQLVDLFVQISGVTLSCSKSTIFRSFKISRSSFGSIPQPDFFLTKGFSILAAVEVKSAHKGHQPKSCRDRQNPSNLDSATDQVSPKKKLKLVSVDKDMDKDIQEREQIEDNEDQNDTFDANESELEKLQKQTLPDNIRHLDITEKKQIRCFMPQLLGQMLACTSIKEKSCFKGLQHPYMTHVLGIGIVGFEVPPRLKKSHQNLKLKKAVLRKFRRSFILTPVLKRSLQFQSLEEHQSYHELSVLISVGRWSVLRNMSR